ncbi:MAG: hypothetical protein WCE65_04775 [Methanoregula sp.]
MLSKEQRANGNDGAVSEAIGFIIIFGIIIAGIGLVTLYGYPMLLQQQSTSNEQIMEKNMIVLQNDLKSIAYKTVPYTETSLNVGGGALTVYNMTYENATESNFTIYNQNGYNPNPNPPTGFPNPITVSTGDLRYESISEQTGLSLENGAVVKRSLTESGSSMLATPRWYYDSQTNTAVIYLIGFVTPSTDVMSQEGVGTVKMDLVLTNYTQYQLASGDSLYVEYQPDNNADYSAAWDNYFTGTLGMVQKPLINQYTYEWLGPDMPQAQQVPLTGATVVIYQYEVAIEEI